MVRNASPTHNVARDNEDNRQGSTNKKQDNSQQHLRLLQGKSEQLKDDDCIGVNFIKQHDNDSNEWIVDSGATVHVCNQKAHFMSYAPSSKSIRMANNTEESVIGIGDVRLVMCFEGRETPVILHDVYHIPAVPCNIFSVSRGEQQGLFAHFRRRVIEDKHGHKIGETVPINGLY
jgi:hypothetical protein